MNLVTSEEGICFCPHPRNTECGKSAGENLLLCIRPEPEVLTREHGSRAECARPPGDTQPLGEGSSVCGLSKNAQSTCEH